MVENMIALTDCRTMHAELKIHCPDCGTTNIITINRSTCNYTLYCKECGAELRLFLRRSRPASFTPPSAISSARTDASSKHFPKRGEKSVAVEIENLYQVYVCAFSVSKDSLKEGRVSWSFLPWSSWFLLSLWLCCCLESGMFLTLGFYLGYQRGVGRYSNLLGRRWENL